MGSEETDYPVSVTPEIEAALEEKAVVAFGVSAGKDSSAMAIRLQHYLDRVGHAGPRVLIHAALGRADWAETLNVCSRLAARLGLELIVVRRRAGDLMTRWETRWANNVSRYAALSCVRLILPFSTAALRFCTSELKHSPICAELKRRFPGRQIISAAAVRHSESIRRSRLPVARAEPRLSRRDCVGWSWYPLIAWPTADVYSYLSAQREDLHEAYTRYGLSRLSCAFCILASIEDLRGAASCESNADIYRTIVDLEIRSTFSFQGNRWLGDVAPHLLTPECRELLADAKDRSKARMAAEELIPKHLLYSPRWPTQIPTEAEALLLAKVRREVSKAVGIEVGYTEPGEIMERYRELLDVRLAEEKRATQKATSAPHVVRSSRGTAAIEEQSSLFV